ncbi:SIR2 family protein [Oceanivirga salmonicida]|uniref:SIR2 family protein n=1 Tax=Oceanivirga salmonicida TaxID=1769291 RepID=UPI0012E1DAFD|nr:SIR2 family protein [Oceanivirga salmonicida]
MDKDINKYIDVLGEEFSQNKLIFFIGAGISKNSGYPDWYNLVKEFKEKLYIDREISDEDFLIIPQQYYEEFGKVEYYKLLEKFFKGDYKVNSIHNILEEMDPKYVITTNYDDLLEKSLNKYNSYDVIKQDKDLPYSKKQKMILKIHGDLENKNIVLKKEDYDNYENNFPLMSNFTKGLFTTHTVLFLGYSLKDKNINHILEWLQKILKSDLRKAYLLTFEYSEKKVDCSKNDKYNIVKKIYLKDIKNDKENTIYSFLCKLFDYRVKKIKELNYSYYKSLKYLPLDILEKYKIRIKSFEFSDDYGIFFDMEIKLNKILSSYDDLSLFNNSFINVMDHYNNKVEEKNIIPFKDRNILKNLNLLNILLEYNKKKFYVEEKKIINKSYISVYGYTLFGDYLKADKVLKEILNKEKNCFSKVWINNIQLLVELKRINEFENYDITDIRERREELKKNYLLSFTKEIKLYEDIYDQKILKNFNEQMFENIIEIKKNNSYQMTGLRKIDRIKLDMRDIFNYIVFNGLVYNDNIQHEIYKNYIITLFE